LTLTADGNRPCEIHHLYLRPADFFTANPSLDVPGRKNDASVLVPCCGTTASSTALKTDESSQSQREGSVQKDPLAHMQGTGPDIEPADVGAGTRKEKGLSRTLSSMLKWRSGKKGSSSS